MIQIVFVKWGKAYGVAEVNGLLAAIRRHTRQSLRPVCITDDASGLDPSIEPMPFAELGISFEQMTGPGCFAKLSVFAPGLLAGGLRTLYFDLDTSVHGDVARLAACLDRRRALYMLPNHYVQTWRLRPLLHRIAPQAYYFANSSVMAFYPEDYHFLAERFRRDYPAALARARATGEALHSAFRADDRYISHAARRTLRVFPSSLAARFQDSYMTFGFRMSALRDALPWVRRQRARRVALTYMGGATKPKQLARIADGTEIVYGPLKTRWNYPELRDYWRAIAAPERNP